MPENKFVFTEQFNKKFLELCEGSVPATVFESVIEVFEIEATRYHFNLVSEANLIRIISSIFDRASFLTEISQYPRRAEIIIAIAGSSNYLTDIVVRNPEYLYQLFDQNYLSTPFSLQNLIEETDEAANRFTGFNSKLNFLRQYKKRITLKIGLSDILGLTHLRTITEQISFLANAVNTKLFNICFEEILAKYNIRSVINKYALCSLGKLGGMELNYSSDIDLILFYDRNSYIEQAKKEFHQLLIEAAELYIKSSTAITEKGFIYRVDFRLRPDGKFSPLCKSIWDYTKYYETRGEDWERQMLIKLNFICGDITLYNQFLEFITPYIYPSSYSSSIKDKVRLMKENIERHNPDKGNVKTFTGGIRDIEFTVQALQLLNGGKNKNVRTGNTLEAISKLSQFKLLKKKEEKIFTEAYIFYRKIEHFLQLMNDTQTHLIPVDKDLLYKLSIYLGFETENQFQEKVAFYRSKVRSVYNYILQSESSSNSHSSIQIKFKDIPKAEKNLGFLRSGIGLIDRKEFDSRTITFFSLIEPVLKKYLIKSVDPDKVLSNFVKVIRNTKFPAIWYGEFRSKKIFTDFLQVCEFSQKSIDILSTSKLVEEFFLSGKVYLKNPADELSNFSTQEIIFLCSYQYALGLINQEKVAEYFQIFVDSKIRSSIVSDKYNYFIGGMGSYAAKSMSFSSDIDLVVVVDTVEGHPEIQSEFQQFLADIKKILFPFDVDFRLRPEGNKSPLVWGIENYKEYLSERARVWEFQSLIKLRFITGDKNIFNELKSSIIKNCARFETQFIIKEIRQMYSSIQAQLIRSANSGLDIKKDRGSLMTIDFITQAICLQDQKLLKSCFGKNVTQKFSVLSRKILPTDIKLLKDNTNFLKTCELAIQIIFNQNNTLVPTDNERRIIIAKLMKCESPQDFIEKIQSITKANNLLFEKYVN